MKASEARSGYYPEFKANKNWKKQKAIICQWEHCIELMPLFKVERRLCKKEPNWNKYFTDKKTIKFPGNCPIFGHMCPDGIYGVQHCEAKIENIEKRIINKKKGGDKK